MPLLHFLLIYDHEQQRLIEAKELGTGVADAARTYAEYERQFKDQRGIEIVLVGADSLDTIRKTHAHYFAESATEPFSELLTGA
jgi:vacuolar-type H+-ATPase subunit F/Vma7